MTTISHQEQPQGESSTPPDVRSIERNGESPAVGRLIVHINGEIMQQQVPKHAHILIGRSRMCDLRLFPHEVSRHHALIIHSSNGTDLVDLGSKNGTLVDGHRIEHHSLQDSEAISIGGCTIRYIADDDR